MDPFVHNRRLVGNKKTPYIPSLCQHNPFGLVGDLMVPVDLLFNIDEFLVSGKYLPKIRILKTDKKAINITTRENYFLMQCYLKKSEEYLCQYISKYLSLQYQDVSSV